MATALDETLARVREKLRGRGFHPPVGAEAVAELERAAGVVLPDDYRRFVTEVASAGPGPPAYGLVPFGEVPRDSWELTAEKQVARLARPFPLTAYWIWEDERPLTGERKALHDRVADGTLALGTDGCGMYWHLVVTGPERGQMWQIADVGAQPCAPRRDFLSWLEHWLDGHDDWWAGFERPDP